MPARHCDPGESHDPAPTLPDAEHGRFTYSLRVHQPFRGQQLALTTTAVVLWAARIERKMEASGRQLPLNVAEGAPSRCL